MRGERRGEMRDGEGHDHLQLPHAGRRLELPVAQVGHDERVGRVRPRVGAEQQLQQEGGREA